MWLSSGDPTCAASPASMRRAARSLSATFAMPSRSHMSTSMQTQGTSSGSQTAAMTHTTGSSPRGQRADWNESHVVRSALRKTAKRATKSSVQTPSTNVGKSIAA